MFFRRVPQKSWYEKAVERVFRDRKLCGDKLLPFGCVRGENGFLYRTKLLHGRYRMEFEIHADGSVRVAVRGADGEEEMPHLAPKTVDRLQERALHREYEEELWHVAECCFEPDFFKADPARSLVEHVREAYGDELEFLWRKSPGSAVVRRKDTENGMPFFWPCRGRSWEAVPGRGWRCLICGFAPVSLMALWIIPAVFRPTT